MYFKRTAGRKWNDTDIKNKLRRKSWAVLLLKKKKKKKNPKKNAVNYLIACFLMLVLPIKNAPMPKEI